MVESTPMIQKIPMVIPKRDRNVRSLFTRNSCRAILKLLQITSSTRNIAQIYVFRIGSRSHYYERQENPSNQGLMVKSVFTLSQRIETTPFLLTEMVNSSVFSV